MKKLLLTLIIAATATASFSQGPWTQKAQIPAPGRHACTAIAINSRIYIGLGHINGIFGDQLFDDWWEFDPATNSWTQKASFGGGPRKYACGFAVGAKGYVGTGEDPSTNWNDDLWEYDPAANIWAQKSPIPGGFDQMLAASAFSIGNKAYLGMGYTYDFWQYDPSNDTWTQMADFPDPNGRTSMTSFSIGTKGYAGCGFDFGPMNDFWAYDPNSNFWSQKASLPGVARSGAFGFAVSGKGYIGSGTTYPNQLDALSDWYEYNPNNDTWKQINDFAGISRRWGGSASTGNFGYMGMGTNGTNLNDFWEFNPQYATGINEQLEKVSVSIYPNPMHEEATLRITNISELRTPGVSVIFYDPTGNKILPEIIRNLPAGQTGSDSYLIRRGSLPAGTYFYEIRSSERSLASGKLIVE